MSKHKQQRSSKVSKGGDKARLRYNNENHEAKNKALKAVRHKKHMARIAARKEKNVQS